MLAIPEGKNCFAWLTTMKENPVCLIIEINNSKKEIKNIKIVNCCFSSSLSYGTIFYGTLFYHFNNPFFTIEDIYMYKGVDCTHMNYNIKLNQICHILKNDIKQISYNNYFVVFGLPIIAKTNEDFSTYLKTVSYKICAVKYKNVKNNSCYVLDIDNFHKTEVNHVIQNNVIQKNVIQKNIIQKNVNQNRIFIVKPDIQNDIYNLYSVENNEYIGLACIPDYKTSVMMNNLFRNIKENNDLDTLEESDDEDEFENSNIDKFVYLDKSHKMNCIFNNKFKKWTPINIC
jgi:hypothetical protein